MWLHRVIFNVRHRLLNRKSTAATAAHTTELPGVKHEKRRAQIIHNRIADLDARSAELQTK